MISNIDSFSRFRPLIHLTTFKTYLEEFFRTPVRCRGYMSADLTNMNPFIDAFKHCDRIFTPTIYRTYIFITQHFFHEHLLAATYRPQNFTKTPLGDTWTGILANIPWFYFCLW